MRRTPRRRSRNRTFRRPLRGGDVDKVKAKLDATPITDADLDMINPTSTFVVATYWWGEANINRNLQKPCPEDIADMARDAVVYRYRDKFPQSTVNMAQILEDIKATNMLPKTSLLLLKTLQGAWQEWKDVMLAKPDIKEEVLVEQKRLFAAEQERLRKEATSPAPAVKSPSSPDTPRVAAAKAARAEAEAAKLAVAKATRVAKEKTTKAAAAAEAARKAVADVEVAKEKATEAEAKATGAEAEAEAEVKANAEAETDKVVPPAPEAPDSSEKPIGKRTEWLLARLGDRKFPEMITEWKSYCKSANVNSIALQTEFERSDYQHGINAKPLFILKLLDHLREKDPSNPKGVLYIDGDMWVHKYPTLFDMEDVDFMARGWNTDSRGNKNSMKKPYLDPNIFETSGGTMFFGNTEGARRLLNKWSTATEAQPGKADDRILSQIFTTQSLVLDTNIISLPIEYLWLTDTYVKHLPNEEFKVTLTVEDAIIEHPYCLTGEERAATQGALANRTPKNYDEEIPESINYRRPPDRIYEYIMCNGNESIRAELSAYLGYIGSRQNVDTSQPLAIVIPFAEKYGEFTPIADKNLKDLPKQARPTGKTVQVPSGDIREILTALRAGANVWTASTDPPALPYPDVDCCATNATTGADSADPYTRYVQVKATDPMMFMAKSPVLQHLLSMCETLADMNTHLKMSYLFLSRIRWGYLGTSSEVAAVPSKIAVSPGGLPRVLHQVWLGTANPGWRKTLFDMNKKVCEANGYVYKLWREGDRNEENFPITFDTQEKARSFGATRWAQVADLARLEIVYNSGGIYVDSIMEITPALFMAVEELIAGGATFVGCNEDPCDPFGRGDNPCKGWEGRGYLSNGFFAATKSNRLFDRLLNKESIRDIYDNKLSDENINRTTGPYFLRTMIRDPVADKVALMDSSQIFQFNQQPTQTHTDPIIDPFISATEVPGAIKVKDGQYFIPGGIAVLQRAALGLPENTPLTSAHYASLVAMKGPVTTYHSGLGGTWSPT